MNSSVKRLVAMALVLVLLVDPGIARAFPILPQRLASAPPIAAALFDHQALNPQGDFFHGVYFKALQLYDLGSLYRYVLNRMSQKPSSDTARIAGRPQTVRRPPRSRPEPNQRPGRLIRMVQTTIRWPLRLMAFGGLPLFAEEYKQVGGQLFVKFGHWSAEHKALETGAHAGRHILDALRHAGTHVGKINFAKMKDAYDGHVAGPALPRADVWYKVHDLAQQAKDFLSRGDFSQNFHDSAVHGVNSSGSAISPLAPPVWQPHPIFTEIFKYDWWVPGLEILAGVIALGAVSYLIFNRQSLKFKVGKLILWIRSFLWERIPATASNTDEQQASHTRESDIYQTLGPQVSLIGRPAISAASNNPIEDVISHPSGPVHENSTSWVEAFWPKGSMTPGQIREAVRQPSENRLRRARKTGDQQTGSDDRLYQIQPAPQADFTKVQKRPAEAQYRIIDNLSGRDVMAVWDGNGLVIPRIDAPARAEPIRRGSWFAGWHWPGLINFRWLGFRISLDWMREQTGVASVLPAEDAPEDAPDDQVHEPSGSGRSWNWHLPSLGSLPSINFGWTRNWQWFRLGGLLPQISRTPRKPPLPAPSEPGESILEEAVKEADAQQTGDRGRWLAGLNEAIQRAFARMHGLPSTPIHTQSLAFLGGLLSRLLAQANEASLEPSDSVTPVPVEIPLEQLPQGLKLWDVLAAILGQSGRIGQDLWAGFLGLITQDYKALAKEADTLEISDTAAPDAAREQVRLQRLAQRMGLLGQVLQRFLKLPAIPESVGRQAEDLLNAITDRLGRIRSRSLKAPAPVEVILEKVVDDAVLHSDDSKEARQARVARALKAAFDSIRGLHLPSTQIHEQARAWLIDLLNKLVHEDQEPLAAIPPQAVRSPNGRTLLAILAMALPRLQALGVNPWHYVMAWFENHVQDLSHEVAELEAPPITQDSIEVVRRQARLEKLQTLLNRLLTVLNANRVPKQESPDSHLRFERLQETLKHLLNRVQNVHLLPSAQTQTQGLTFLKDLLARLLAEAETTTLEPAEDGTLVPGEIPLEKLPNGVHLWDALAAILRQPKGMGQDLWAGFLSLIAQNFEGLTNEADAIETAGLSEPELQSEQASLERLAQAIDILRQVQQRLLRLRAMTGPVREDAERLLAAITARLDEIRHRLENNRARAAQLGRKANELTTRQKQADKILEDVVVRAIQDPRADKEWQLGIQNAFGEAWHRIQGIKLPMDQMEVLGRRFLDRLLAQFTLSETEAVAPEAVAEAPHGDGPQGDQSRHWRIASLVIMLLLQLHAVNLNPWAHMLSWFEGQEQSISREVGSFRAMSEVSYSAISYSQIRRSRFYRLQSLIHNLLELLGRILGLDILPVSYRARFEKVADNLKRLEKLPMAPEPLIHKNILAEAVEDSLDQPSNNRSQWLSALSAAIDSAFNRMRGLPSPQLHTQILALLGSLLSKLLVAATVPSVESFDSVTPVLVEIPLEQLPQGAKVWAALTAILGHSWGIGQDLWTGFLNLIAQNFEAFTKEAEPILAAAGVTEHERQGDRAKLKRLAQKMDLLRQVLQRILRLPAIPELSRRQAEGLLTAISARLDEIHSRSQKAPAPVQVILEKVIDEVTVHSNDSKEARQARVARALKAAFDSIRGLHLPSTQIHEQARAWLIELLNKLVHEDQNPLAAIPPQAVRSPDGRTLLAILAAALPQLQALGINPWHYVMAWFENQVHGLSQEVSELEAPPITQDPIEVVQRQARLQKLQTQLDRLLAVLNASRVSKQESPDSHLRFEQLQETLKQLLNRIQNVRVLPSSQSKTQGLALLKGLLAQLLAEAETTTLEPTEDRTLVSGEIPLEKLPNGVHLWDALAALLGQSKGMGQDLWAGFLSLIAQDYEALSKEAEPIEPVNATEPERQSDQARLQRLAQRTALLGQILKRFMLLPGISESVRNQAQDMLTAIAGSLERIQNRPQRAPVVPIDVSMSPSGAHWKARVGQFLNNPAARMSLRIAAGIVLVAGAILLYASLPSGEQKYAFVVPLVGIVYTQRKKIPAVAQTIAGNVLDAGEYVAYHAIRPLLSPRHRALAGTIKESKVVVSEQVEPVEIILEEAVKEAGAQQAGDRDRWLSGLNEAIQRAFARMHGLTSPQIHTQSLAYLGSLLARMMAEAEKPSLEPSDSVTPVSVEIPLEQLPEGLKLWDALAAILGQSKGIGQDLWAGFLGLITQDFEALAKEADTIENANATGPDAPREQAKLLRLAHSMDLFRQVVQRFLNLPAIPESVGRQAKVLLAAISARLDEIHVRLQKVPGPVEVILEKVVDEVTAHPGGSKEARQARVARALKAAFGRIEGLHLPSSQISAQAQAWLINLLNRLVHEDQEAPTESQPQVISSPDGRTLLAILAMALPRLQALGVYPWHYVIAWFENQVQNLSQEVSALEAPPISQEPTEVVQRQARLQKLQTQLDRLLTILNANRLPKQESPDSHLRFEQLQETLKQLLNRIQNVRVLPSSQSKTQGLALLKGLLAQLLAEAETTTLEPTEDRTLVSGEIPLEKLPNGVHLWDALAALLGQSKGMGQDLWAGFLSLIAQDYEALSKEAEPIEPVNATEPERQIDQARLQRVAQRMALLGQILKRFMLLPGIPATARDQASRLIANIAAGLAEIQAQLRKIGEHVEPPSGEANKLSAEKEKQAEQILEKFVDQALENHGAREDWLIGFRNSFGTAWSSILLLKLPTDQLQAVGLRLLDRLLARFVMPQTETSAGSRIRRWRLASLVMMALLQLHSMNLSPWTHLLNWFEQQEQTLSQEVGNFSSRSVVTISAISYDQIRRSRFYRLHSLIRDLLELVGRILGLDILPDAYRPRFKKLADNLKRLQEMPMAPEPRVSKNVLEEAVKDSLEQPYVDYSRWLSGLNEAIERAFARMRGIPNTQIHSRSLAVLVSLLSQLLAEADAPSLETSNPVTDVPAEIPLGKRSQGPKLWDALAAILRQSNGIGQDLWAGFLNLIAQDYEVLSKEAETIEPLSATEPERQMEQVRLQRLAQRMALLGQILQRFLLLPGIPESVRNQAKDMLTAISGKLQRIQNRRPMEKPIVSQGEFTKVQKRPAEPGYRIVDNLATPEVLAQWDGQGLEIPSAPESNVRSRNWGHFGKVGAIAAGIILMIVSAPWAIESLHLGDRSQEERPQAAQIEKRAAEPAASNPSSSQASERKPSSGDTSVSDIKPQDNKNQPADTAGRYAIFVALGLILLTAAGWVIRAVIQLWHQTGRYYPVAPEVDPPPMADIQPYAKPYIPSNRHVWVPVAMAASLLVVAAVLWIQFHGNPLPTLSFDWLPSLDRLESLANRVYGMMDRRQMAIIGSVVLGGLAGFVVIGQAVEQRRELEKLSPAQAMTRLMNAGGRNLTTTALRPDGSPIKGSQGDISQRLASLPPTRPGTPREISPAEVQGIHERTVLRFHHTGPPAPDQERVEFARSQAHKKPQGGWPSPDDEHVGTSEFDRVRFLHSAAFKEKERRAEEEREKEKSDAENHYMGETGPDDHNIARLGVNVSAREDDAGAVDPDNRRDGAVVAANAGLRGWPLAVQVVPLTAEEQSLQVQLLALQQDIVAGSRALDAIEVELSGLFEEWRKMSGNSELSLLINSVQEDKDAAVAARARKISSPGEPLPTTIAALLRALRELHGQLRAALKSKDDNALPELVARLGRMRQAAFVIFRNSNLSQRRRYRLLAIIDAMLTKIQLQYALTEKERIEKIRAYSNNKNLPDPELGSLEMTMPSRPSNTSTPDYAPLGPIVIIWAVGSWLAGWRRSGASKNGGKSRWVRPTLEEILYKVPVNSAAAKLDNSLRRNGLHYAVVGTAILSATALEFGVALTVIPWSLYLIVRGNKLINRPRSAPSVAEPASGQSPAAIPEEPSFLVTDIEPGDHQPVWQGISAFDMVPGAGFSTASRPGRRSPNFPNSAHQPAGPNFPAVCAQVAREAVRCVLGIGPEPTEDDRFTFEMDPSLVPSFAHSEEMPTATEADPSYSSAEEALIRRLALKRNLLFKSASLEELVRNVDFVSMPYVGEMSSAQQHKSGLIVRPIVELLRKQRDGLMLVMDPSRQEPFFDQTEEDILHIQYCLSFARFAQGLLDEERDLEKALKQRIPDDEAWWTFVHRWWEMDPTLENKILWADHVPLSLRLQAEDRYVEMRTKIFARRPKPTDYFLDNLFAFFGNALEAGGLWLNNIKTVSDIVPTFIRKRHAAAKAALRGHVRNFGETVRRERRQAKAAQALVANLAGVLSTLQKESRSPAAPSLRDVEHAETTYHHLIDEAYAEDPAVIDYPLVLRFSADIETQLALAEKRTTPSIVTASDLTVSLRAELGALLNGENGVKALLKRIGDPKQDVYELRAAASALEMSFEYKQLPRQNGAAAAYAKDRELRDLEGEIKALLMRINDLLGNPRSPFPSPHSGRRLLEHELPAKPTVVWATDANQIEPPFKPQVIPLKAGELPEKIRIHSSRTGSIALSLMISIGLSMIFALHVLDARAKQMPVRGLQVTQVEVYSNPFHLFIMIVVFMTLLVAGIPLTRRLMEWNDRRLVRLSVGSIRASSGGTIAERSEDPGVKETASDRLLSAIQHAAGNRVLDSQNPNDRRFITLLMQAPILLDDLTDFGNRLAAQSNWSDKDQVEWAALEVRYNALPAAPLLLALLVAKRVEVLRMHDRLSAGLPLARFDVPLLTFRHKVLLPSIRRPHASDVWRLMRTIAARLIRWVTWPFVKPILMISEERLAAATESHQMRRKLPPDPKLKVPVSRIAGVSISAGRQVAAAGFLMGYIAAIVMGYLFWTGRIDAHVWTMVRSMLSRHPASLLMAGPAFLMVIDRDSKKSLIQFPALATILGAAFSVTGVIIFTLVVTYPAVTIPFLIAGSLAVGVRMILKAEPSYDHAQPQQSPEQDFTRRAS